jgi:hypothetical protein
MSKPVKYVRRNKNGQQVTVFDDTLEGTSKEGLPYRDFVSSYLNCKLPADSVIHHKNRNRNDNVIENLLLVPNQSLHMYIHSLLKQNKKTLVLAFENWLENWMDLIKRSPQKNPSELLLLADKRLMNSYEDLVKINANKINTISEFSFAIQYSKFKVIFPESILFIQKGIYYNCYGEDALRINKLLGWKLYFDKFMNLEATGCPINNLGFESDLVSNNIAYVLVDQSEVRTKKILDRFVKKIVD